MRIGDDTTEDDSPWPDLDMAQFRRDKAKEDQYNYYTSIPVSAPVVPPGAKLVPKDPVIDPEAEEAEPAKPVIKTKIPEQGLHVDEDDGMAEMVASGMSAAFDFLDT